jgi:hypothetical protein
MDGRASCGAMALDGSYRRHLEASVVPGLQKDRPPGSHMSRCNFVNAPAAHIGEGRYMPPCLEAARKSPGLEEVAAAFAYCAEVVAETVGRQVHRMNIALQDDSHLMEHQCCMVLA